jgi:hypothetical protein
MLKKKKIQARGELGEDANAIGGLLFSSLEDPDKVLHLEPRLGSTAARNCNTFVNGQTKLVEYS